MEKVRNFYFEQTNGQINTLAYLEFSQLSSDISFNYGIDKSVNLQSIVSTGRTYYYR